MERKIKKEEIGKFLRRLSEKYEVIIPTEFNDSFEFRVINRNKNEIADGIEKFSNSKIPPKKFLIPESEIAFEFSEIDGNAIIKEINIDKRERIIFGIRPCDVNAILLLDIVKKEKPKDLSYFKRRERTLLFSLECNTLCKNSFCTSLGTGPFIESGADLRFTDIGDYYLVKALTDNGEKFLNFPEFENADKKDKILRDKMVKNIDTKIIGHEEISEKLEEIDEEYWDSIATRCIECYICTLLCPTCYCFNVFDTLSVFGNSGHRIIFQDSCMSRDFSRLAGGENPRRERRERLRNRIYHKLKYFVDRYGRLGCTGCGRCVSLCPVGIDIREFIFE
ncbi:MAG: hypothetical protein DRO95_01380 [Candidatus Altiarchaeales archaeon]|nr:MAG: hypothetical protein DRO95_01380 [Candidatus Altiarchaeales archaeon]